MNRRVAVLALSCVPSVLAYACSDSNNSPPLSGPDAGHYDATANFDSSGGYDTGSTSDAGRSDAGDAAVDAHDSAVACPIGQDEMVYAAIKVTADDYLKLWVNGELVDDKTSTWGTVDTKSVALFRSPLRKNVIAIEARNAYNTTGLDRGLIVDLSFPLDGGADSGIPAVVTDSTWKVVGTTQDGGVPDGGLPDGGTPGVAAWTDLAFDDSMWAAAVDEGAHGVSPWGAVFGTSTARWIWSYDSAAASSKAVDDKIYVRKTFYLDVSGTPSSTQPSCP